MNNPSVHESNKLLRVLQGEKLKYTIRVHHLDGKITEFQCNQSAKIKWIDDARCLWLCQGDYESRPIMQWVEGMIILTEENPK